MKKRNGFTLVELLVVIAIMGILSMITVSQFTTARKKARDVSRKSDLNSVSKSIGMYYTDYGAFPDENKINGVGGSEFSDQGYVYMKVLPTEPLKNDPNWPQYCYVMNTSNNSYAIFAALENTDDADCIGHEYIHCGGKEYCYSVTSPNASPSDFANLNQ